MNEKARIIAALRTWIHQRPGLEFANYGDLSSYRAEVRSIGKDLAQARELLRFVELRDSITADMLRAAFSNAYSGRLSWDGTRLSYCTGQYWPTEYRRAACAVLASAIWDWTREHCMPPAIANNDGEWRYDGKRAGDYLRAVMRQQFGRAIQSRWFN